MSNFYIPIMRSLQAEQLAIRSLTSTNRNKIRPLLQYVTDKRLSSILEENQDINFFVEFPQLSFNRDVRTLHDREEKFDELRNEYQNFVPVVTILDEETPRNLVQHTFRLLKKFDSVLIKTEIRDLDGRINNFRLLCIIALYSCLPLDKSYFLIDLGYIKSSEEIQKHFPLLSDILQDAMWGIAGTIWPHIQTEFPKMEVTILKNWPFISFLKKRGFLSFYSDYLTDNPLSPIIDRPQPLTIVPYFKLTSLDGKYGLIVRAINNRDRDSIKEAAQLALSEEGFVHDEGCAGCDELRKIADTSTDALGNPMSRKKLSFVHHLEVISALI